MLIERENVIDNISRKIVGDISNFLPIAGLRVSKIPLMARQIKMNSMTRMICRFVCRLFWKFKLKFFWNFLFKVHLKINLIFKSHT